MSKECYDHLGNKFKSIKDMLKYYNIDIKDKNVVVVGGANAATEEAF